MTDTLQLDYHNQYSCISEYFFKIKKDIWWRWQWQWW